MFSFVCELKFQNLIYTKWIFFPHKLDKIKWAFLLISGPFYTPNTVFNKIDHLVCGAGMQIHTLLEDECPSITT